MNRTYLRLFGAQGYRRSVLTSRVLVAALWDLAAVDYQSSRFGPPANPKWYFGQLWRRAPQEESCRNLFPQLADAQVCWCLHLFLCPKACLRGCDHHCLGGGSGRVVKIRGSPPKALQAAKCKLEVKGILNWPSSGRLFELMASQGEMFNLRRGPG